MIITVTLNPAIDESASVQQVQPERKLRCTQPVYEPGGGGINVSRAISNLGGSSLALWAKGGARGDHFQTLLSQAHLDHRSFDVDGEIRENLMVLEESTGRNYRFGMPGPNMTEQQGERFADEISRLEPDYLVLSGSLPPGLPLDFYARMIRKAPAKTRVIIDTSGDPLLHALEAGVYLAKPNINELRHVAGVPVESDSQIKQAAHTLVREQKAQVVAVSLGSAGAIFIADGGDDRIYSPTVPIKSKVGAGDSMVAGIVLKLEEGWPALEAVRYGVAAGASAVMTPGSSLCRYQETEHLFDQMKIEEELYLARH